jgi:hypothetical protein
LRIADGAQRRGEHPILLQKKALAGKPLADPDVGGLLALSGEFGIQLSH